MCFSKPAKPQPIPPPPPVPLPPTIREEGLVAQQDAMRRKKAMVTGPQGTVMTSPLGDVGAGANAVKASLSSGATVGAKLV